MRPTKKKELVITNEGRAVKGQFCKSVLLLATIMLCSNKLSEVFSSR